MLRGLLSKLVGDSDEREIARLQEQVEQINALEPEFEALSDPELRAKTAEFRQRLEQGETLDDLVTEAFAAVREAAKRAVGLRHYDVQLIGGMVLHEGKIAEMKTGEGKTLAATAPLYLNALSGEGVHLVTPNDYLSKVGVQWMGPIYQALGLSVGVIQSAAANPDQGSFLYDPGYPSDDDRFLNLRPISRREAYQADITYGTNNEFGFDYLRDNMVRDLSQCVQRGFHFAIIDEVDNILIDEARTPLIISGPAEEPSHLYRSFAQVVRQLALSSPQSVEEEAPDGDYVLDQRTQTVTLTDRGVEKVEAMVPMIDGGESIYDPEHAHMLPYLDNALRAHVVFKRDKDYIVQNGEVIIVDDFTGRLMYGRRFSEGLHQAIEAKEGVTVQRESLTYATITFQNYFRMYEKLAGMTGTAKTEEEEFQKIYDMDVVVLPTNVEYRATYGDLETHERRVDELDEVTFAGVLNGRQNTQVTTYEPLDSAGRRFFKRLDLQDVIYADQPAKFHAVVDEIAQLHEEGRPVLVGTVAIETSERLSRMLKRRGIPHQVLNAKHHEQEAVIIAQAGQPGGVTIATNMAGRGVDIKLGGDPEGVARQRLRKEGYDLTEVDQGAWKTALEQLGRGEDADQDPRELSGDGWTEILAEAVRDCSADRERVVALGGLHILGTERHEARRIDNQLRGRSGRQGDPGSSRFYISLEDELMQRFGGERVKTMMDRLGVEKDVPLEHAWLDKSIESAQQRVEGYNFDIRKHVLEYDDVVNKQRAVIYDQRRQVLQADDLRDQVLRMVEDEIERVVDAHTPGPDPEEWDMLGLQGELRTFLPLRPDVDVERWEGLAPSEFQEELCDLAAQAYEEVNRAVGRQVYKQAVREDVSLGTLAESSDPAQRTVYGRMVALLGREPSEEERAQPVYQLAEELQTLVEQAFVETYRLFRDRQLMLQAVDNLWVRHLTDLSDLREGIGLRAYGQQNPLVAYRKEAHEMYQSLLANIERQVARSVYLLPRGMAAPRERPALQTSRLRVRKPAAAAATRSRRAAAATESQAGQPQDVRPDCELGRNDPCWCGSGKKYKHCHMRKDEQARRARAAATRSSQMA
ncbi:MAG: preprotein translocase subunit SecA [Chloroflexota bacterium]|nr:preprotein translocase subunit SecA [Chloroflexota bacterium]